MASLPLHASVSEPVIRLRLFGVIEAWSYTGENVLPRGRKAQAILSYLALTSEDVVPRKRFAELLWSTRWGDQARASLRQSLIEIRTAFARRYEGLITIERDRVTLNRDLVWVDGLSSRSDSQPIRPDSSPLDPELLLETLFGLDQRFDDWIKSARQDIARSLRRVTGDGATTIRPFASGPLIQRTLRPLKESNEEERVSSRPLHEAADIHGVPPDSLLKPRHRLTVSVSPFAYLGDGSDDDYVVSAITQEIATALARFRWIQVRLGRPDDKHEGEYKLDGYVSRTNTGFRLVIRLIDQTDRDIILWTYSEAVDIPWRESAIGEIVQRIVEQLDPEILAIETRKVLRRPASSRDAYECVLRGIALLYRFEKESWHKATANLLEATVIDPEYGRAFAFSALCRITAVAQGWSASAEREIQLASDEAAKAITCDPHDSLALALRGHITSFIHHDFSAALKLFDRAIRANPSCGFSWAYSSLTFAYLAETEEAARRLARAREVMIHDPFCSFLESFNVVVTYFSKEWVDTVLDCRRALAVRPSMTNIRKYLISALCFLERFEEASREHRELLRLEPDFTWTSYLVRYPFGRSQDRIDLETVLRRGQFVANGRSEVRTRSKALQDRAAVVTLRTTQHFKQK
jgi:tetratricopeptide (TPR) repeat protein/DNA-binding winged helix-turn-helix (wHTH) protein